jgi:hypothetical protein
MSTFSEIAIGRSNIGVDPYQMIYPPRDSCEVFIKDLPILHISQNHVSFLHQYFPTSGFVVH